MVDIRETLRKLATQIRDEQKTGANTAYRVGSLLLAMIESGIDIGELSKTFIRKDIVDFTDFLLKLLGGVEVGVYKEGLSGASIDKDGNAEFGKLLTRLRAILSELQVNGAAEFRGNLSSEEFISGFIGGKGWAIMKKEVLNALGVPETKYTEEIDDLIVRGTLRVFEMIISQLLGENDNRIFTGMMEVDHYDPDTGRVYLDTYDGKMYNPFRKDDYIMVQQFNGMPGEENNHYVTKHYELVITDAGCGSLDDKENRLDWVTFKNFTCSMEGGSTALITKGDTFVRVDNASDPDRKGIMQIMTVGNSTPYMDVVYGLKTDPDNSLKGRLGNLNGIYHHLFGWLKGFGELLTNLYAVGDFRLRQTGENLDTKIEMLKSTFSTNYKKLTYDITEDDNYLTNATFTENMEHWQYEDDIKFITYNDEVMILNRSTVVAKDNFAIIEEYDGRDMLHICNSQIRQLNADIRKPGTHKEYKPATGEGTTEEYVEVKDTLYLSVKFLARTSGLLSVGFQGAGASDLDALPFSTISVTGSYDWQTVQVSGTWDGKGDFILKYTGDMYVSLLSVTDNALADYKKEVSTSIEQTASNIRLTGKNINNLKNTVTNLGIDLDAAKEKIAIYSNKLDTLTGTVTNLGIDLDATKERIALYATKIGNNEASISALQIKADSILSTVTSVQGDLEQAKKTASAAAQAAMDKATQADNNANDAWWKAYYAQQDADSAYSKSVSNATAIAQIDSAVSILAGRFTSDGRLVNTGGLLVTADKTELSNEIYDINGKLAKKAEVSTSVQYNPSTGRVTSSVKVAADQVILEGYITANGNVEITPDGRIIGKSASFENTVMRYKVNDISFLTTKVYYNTWANINALSSANLNEYDLAVLSSGTYIDGVWYSARSAFVYRASQWKLLPGLSVYTSTDSGGNVSVSYAVLNLNPGDGNIVVLDAPVKLYVVAPETGPGNYGTTIKLMSMTQAVARNVISGQWANREYHVGRYSSSVSENIVMTGRAGSTINVGGYCELVSTPLGWLATANVGMVNDRMIARLKIKYISSSRTYSVSSECLYNYSSGSFYTSRTAAGSVVVSIPYALVSDVNASDIKVYGTGVVFDVDKNTVISKAPGKATLQSYYQENSSLAKALVYISDDDTLNDGDFVMEIYKYSNTYICEKSSITG